MILSVIIVNFNAVDYLRNCVRSIYAGSRGLSYEVIVVDSGSYDGCREMLREEFPEVIFLQAENIGFARANNLARAHASGHYLLFLNPDTEIVGNALWEIVNRADALEKFGAGTCRVLNGDGSIQWSCVQSIPTIWNQMLDSQFLRRRFPRAEAWGMAPIFHSPSAPCTVEAVSGACMLVRRAVFDAVDGFSEEYFMYSEDIDFCYKTGILGYKTYFIPSARVFHFGGGSSKTRGDGFADVMIYEARLKFLRKFRGSIYSFAYRGMMACAAVARLALIGCLSWLERLAPASAMKGWRMRAQKWAEILRWSLGSERWIGDFR